MNSRPKLGLRLLASVAAALVTSLVAYFAVAFAFYIALQGQADYAGSVLALFLGPAVFLAVLLSVAAVLDGLATTARVIVFSIIVSVFSSYFGIFVRDLILGGSVSVSSADSQRTLYGPGLVFIVGAILTTCLLSRRVYAWVVRFETGAGTAVHHTLLVRAPTQTLAKGELTHLKRKPVKADLAAEQWAAYVAALEAEGFDSFEVEADDRFPDSVFIEDTVIMLGQVAVIASPGAESRRGEQDAVVETLRDLGLETRYLRLPGTLDGGDVLKVGETIYVGRGGRTNAEGIRQFRAIAAELGYTLVAVPVTRALHLKSSVTALPDGTVIGHPSLVDHPELFSRYLEVPEVAGVAVVVLSGSAVLMSASAPKTAALIADLGYRVVTVDISEFEKLEGCVTCLSVRIR